MESPDSPIPPDDKPARDSAGRLLPGGTANPSGANGLEGKARYEIRAQKLMENLTVGELQKIVTDPNKMRDYTVADGVILIHLARMLTGKEVGKERERLLDRLQGKPVQTIVTTERKSFTEEEYASMTPEQAQAAYEQSLKS